MAVQRHADTVAHHPVHGADEDRAVEVGASRLDVLGHLGGVAGEVHHGAVRDHHAAPPLGLGHLEVLAQVAVLAVHGDHELRVDEVVHALDVGAVGVARDVVGAVAVLDVARESTGDTVERLMGNKPEARFAFISERAAFADGAELDI